jgi:hypothetical protein
MVAIAEYDVHSDQWITTGHAAAQPAPEAAVPSARQLWREAVAQAAEKARAALPEANGRIDCAVALVLQGDVELLTDGTAKVGSQSQPQTVYHVNGQCQCKDFERAPHGGQCKHRIARGLAIRAQQRLEEMMEHLDEGNRESRIENRESPEVPDSPFSMHHSRFERPEGASVEATVCITAQRSDGRKVTWTFRGTEQAAVAWFEERNAYLDAQFSAAQPPTPPQAPHAPAAAAPEPPALPPCPLHPGEVLALHTKGEQQWRSHRLADGKWCRGK